MEFDFGTLTDAGLRQLKKMELEEVAALKLCLLSTGALMGLSLKRPLVRRLAGLGCTLLAVGTALPLIYQYLTELERSPVPDPVVEADWVEAPEEPPASL